MKQEPNIKPLEVLVSFGERFTVTRKIVSKVCTRCKTEKPIAEFWKHNYPATMSVMQWQEEAENHRLSPAGDGDVKNLKWS